MSHEFNTCKMKLLGSDWMKHIFTNVPAKGSYTLDGPLTSATNAPIPVNFPAL